jgi:hypothetical protein
VWSQWPWLSTTSVDVARSDLEPTHVLDAPVRRQTCVEQDAHHPAVLLDRHETRKPVLGAQRVAGAAALEEARGDDGRGECLRQRLPRGRALIAEQQVGHVVDQRGDRHRVDRFECDRLHRADDC